MGVGTTPLPARAWKSSSLKFTSTSPVMPKSQNLVASSDREVHHSQTCATVKSSRGICSLVFSCGERCAVSVG